MKKLLCFAIVSSVFIVSPCFAEEDPFKLDAPSVQANDAPRFRRVGVSFDGALPDGLALGLLLRPFRSLPWLRFDGALTYNALNGGVRGSVILDPFNYWITPLVELDLGHAFPGKPPGVTKAPEISYTYENILLGPSFGSQNGFRFFILGGFTHLNVATDHFSGSVNLSNGMTIGNPSVSAWVFPSAKLGFSVLF